MAAQDSQCADALQIVQDKMMITKITGITINLLKNIFGSESKNISTISNSIFKQPIKLIAAFFAAPFLLYKIIQRTENPRRRLIAKLGLIFGLIGAYFAGTFLGTTAATILIITKVGLILGLAFWIGTALSVFLTVLFQILIFNLITYSFLHLSSEEVINYLNDLSR